jgi:photosystem I P700 chlorophyll a apoprotein A2
MGMDVLIWTFSLGNRIYVLNFLAYWQELIETIVWAHERTPLANLIRWKDKPVVLSIVQARLVGFSSLYNRYIFTYAPFVIASTLGKFVNCFYLLYYFYKKQFYKK